MHLFNSQQSSDQDVLLLELLRNSLSLSSKIILIRWFRCVWNWTLNINLQHGDVNSCQVGMHFNHSRYQSYSSFMWGPRDVFNIRAKGLSHLKSSSIFFCVNAAWKMIKEEFKKRGTECAMKCLVWSYLCFFQLGYKVIGSCCFACPSWYSKIESLFVYLAILCWRETFRWPPRTV